jgi:hypothetical protein
VSGSLGHVWEQGEPFERLFSDAGLVEVGSRAIDVPTVFRDCADYWEPFLGGQGPAPAYVTSLGDAERARLHDLLRGRLPTAPDGSISLVARAWAARGLSAAPPGEART